MVPRRIEKNSSVKGKFHEVCFHRAWHISYSREENDRDAGLRGERSMGKPRAEAAAML